MAEIGDDAAAAGMDLVPSSGANGKVRFGWREINKTRDYIAQKVAALSTTILAKIWGTANGGTGANTAAGARANLAVPETAVAELKFTSPSFGRIAFQAPGVAFPTTIASTSDIPAPVDISGKADQAALNNVYDGGMSPNVYNRNITWNRRGVWVGDNGVLGYASSRRDAKQDFEAPGWTVEQLMPVPILHYRYIAAVEAERNGEGRAATEIGTIADDLHALGLWEFVIYSGHGEDARPEGVHYELLSLAALWLAQQAMQRVIDLEARLDAQ